MSRRSDYTLVFHQGGEDGGKCRRREGETAQEEEKEPEKG